MKWRSLFWFLIFVLGGAAIVAAGQLTSVTAIPSDNRAGAFTIYTFSFRTSSTGNGSIVGLPADGKILITFPAGFNVVEAEIASATDPMVLNGGLVTTGSGNVITVFRDSTGAVVPGDTIIGVKVGMIQNDTLAASGYFVTIETQEKNGTVIDTGTSATFAISANVLATFKFDPIGNQDAGVAFPVRITAKDLYNNTVTSFSSVVALSDLTGSIIPDTTTNFISGVWNGSVQITRTHPNNKLTATGQNKSGNSSVFAVNPGSLHHFNFQAIASPQTAGVPFTISITAQDAYNNTVTNFNSTATLSDHTGSISPTTTDVFSNGQWSGDVTITKKQNDVRITVSANSISSQSQPFNVQSAAVDHFDLAPIASQTAGMPFLIEVTARDQYNNQVDQFDETVNITDDTGTLTPTVSGSFLKGYWSGNVTITQIKTNNIIRVQRTANGTQSGSSNGFDVSFGGLDHFEFSPIGTPQTAGMAFPIRIVAKDAYGNTVTNFSGVTASLSDLTNTVSPNTTGPFSQGEWTGNVMITKSWLSDQISVTYANKSGTSNGFNVNPHDLAHFQFSYISSPHIAGQNFQITITAEDIYGNRVTNFTNAATLSDETGTIFPTSTGNFTSGQWTGSVRITKSQNDVTITATRSSVTGQSNAFNIEPNSLDHFSIATIGTKAAGVPFAITVTAKDAYENRVTSFNGTVSIQDLTGTITPNNSSTFDLGQWSGDVTITQVRNGDQITVTNTAGPQSGTSNNFDVIAGNIDHFEIATISSPQTAGVPFAITITAKDANNATVTGYTGTANLSDLSGTISPIVTTNFVNGVWTGNVTITKSYTNNKITASGAGKSGSSNVFNIQPNSLTHFSFATITSPKTAGQPFSITIAARDGYDNIVTSFSGTATLSDNTGSLSPTSTGAFINGEWTGSVTITKSQNDVEITAAQGSASGTSNKFNVQSAALHHFSLNNISSQQSNVPFTITVTARDQYNNIATQFTAKVTISDKTNTISPTLSDNFTNGQWSGNVTITQAYSNNAITVTREGGTESGTSNNFDVTASGVDHFVILPVSNQIAGQPFNITIRAEDAANNLVTSFTGTALISDLTSSITPKTTGSFSGGQWTGSVTITKSRTADTITASSGGKTGTSNPFNVDPAALDHFRLSTISSPQVAGTAFSVTITAEDIYNNKASSFTGTVNLSDYSGSLTPTVSDAFTSGEWTGNVTITKAITDNVIQVTGSGKTGQSNGFNVIAASLHHFVLETISTQSAGLPFAITIIAQDNFGNTATQFTSKVNISDKTNTISPTVSGNFVNGQWTGNVVIAQAYSNDVITVVRQGGSETGSSNSFDVISSAVDHFVISTVANQVAGQPFSITIRAEDSNNNLVTNFTGVASLSDLTNTISPTTTGSFSAGQWSGSVTITKSRTGNTITVTSSGKAGTSNSFNVNPASLDHFRVSTIGSPQVAGQPFTITITAEDLYDNKVTSFNNTVNLSESTNSITPTVTTNFSSGEWAGPVTITKSYTDNIIMVSGFGKTGQSNKFNINPAALHHFVISPIATQAAGIPFAITVTGQDNYGNTATQFTGKVNISDKTNTISPSESGNFSNGRWTGNVLISQANSNDVITVVRQGGSETGSSNSFDVISSTIDHFVISTIGNQVAGQPFSITIRAEDKNNNLVTSFTGTATLSDLTNTISPTTTTNFTSGQWSGNVTITKSRTGNTITATSSGKAGTSNQFNISPAGLDHFRFQAIPSPQVAGSPFSITIYAEDAYGNQVTSFVSTANLSDLTGTISPSTTSSFSAGSWTGNVTITKSQTDVTITATQSGKSGQSNIFNVNPGALASFQIGNISTQAAGVPFAISVTGLDAYGNIASQFTGTVNISDLTNTISPTISGNFAAGKWTGNVTITQSRQNNRITVTNTGGAQTGQSNLFDVLPSSVDHFVIDNISSPKTAGVPFQVTITAKDKDDNTVTGFTGTATLSDLSGTISPTATGSFVNGVWQGNVTITKSWANNRITATSSGKAGQSNSFTVVHNVLDYFEFANIASPKTAGVSFPITIKAKDIYGNVVTSYNASVVLTDNTGTINPTTTTNFTSGEWTGNVRITKKQNDVYIVASGSGKIGQSNFFNVIPNNPVSLKIRDAAGGSGSEIGALNMSLDDKITLYAAGYDAYNNYVRDIISNWRASGTLDQPSPASGRFTVFDPKTPGTSGKIHADSTGLQPDSTGTITVGSIAYVKIRTAPDGAGVELGNTTITADQNVVLYCAGYDAGKNYIGDVSVQWRSIGTLTPAVNDTGKSINFQPTKAPASGRIIADHPTSVDDSTGIITIVPGAPVGEILLSANPAVIPANGTSTSIIKSEKIKDADGNIIAQNTQFTVTSTLGTITTTDVNPLIQGVQVAANDSGKIQFTLRSATAGGTAFVSVSSVNGSAVGYLAVTMSNLNIVSVSSSKLAVSRGQTNVPVDVVVQNLGTSTVTNLSAGLIFKGPAPLFEDRNADFPSVVRTDGITSIPGGANRTLTFNVSVSGTAKTDTVTVDSWISGQISGVTVTDTFAVTKHKWAVQMPPQLRITRVSSLLNEVAQGRANINVSMRVVNQGQANATVSSTALSFWSNNFGKDVTGEYQVVPEVNNPTLIPGNGVPQVLNYLVSVSTGASLGEVVINGRLTGNDANSGASVAVNAADTTHKWQVRLAPLVGIKQFSPSQSLVTKNQTMPWQLIMVIENKGGTVVRLDSASVAFFLVGNNISSQYTVVKPTKFQKSGTNLLAAGETDTLKFVVTKTGSSVGQVVIAGKPFMRDQASGNPISIDETYAGIIVQEPAALRITNLIPSQNSVTRNQGQDWTIKVVVNNEGGSDIGLVLQPTKTFLTFSLANDFVIKYPTALNSGRQTLPGGSIDTLTYIIDGTTTTTGNCLISARVTGIQTTSGDTTIATFQRTTPVVIEEPARIRIVSVINQAQNSPFVNRGQVFPLLVTLENNGQDEIKEATVTMTSNRGSIPGGISQVVADIPGNGGRKEQAFSIKADSSAAATEIFQVKISKAEAQNTKEPAAVIYEPAADSTESVVIQNPATFQIITIISPDTIRASQVEPWKIGLVVRNTGMAAAVVQTPAPENILIKVNNVDHHDYIINPPTAFQGGGLILAGGQTDTLVYTVTISPTNAGPAAIEAVLSANDRNNQKLLISPGRREFFIRSSAAVQLLRTEPICYNYDGAKGLVNRGQSFSVRVTVQNLGRKKVKDVVVMLTTTGGSIIAQPQVTIPSIDYNEVRFADFDVVANPNQTDLNEVFTSTIISAIEFDTGLPAVIDNTANNKARIVVYNPATLVLTAWATDSVFTTNQSFSVKALVKNVGTMPADVDDAGVLRISVPKDYRIIVGTDTIPNSHIQPFKPDQEIGWTIFTPEYASGPDTIVVAIDIVPKDKNVDQRAFVAQRGDTIVVRALATNILYRTMIAEPSGAIDRIVSTYQTFQLKSEIQFSENLKDVAATLILPDGEPGYNFHSTTNPTQSVQKGLPVYWSIDAPAVPDADFRLMQIRITAKEKGAPKIYLDSLWVKTVARAKLKFVRGIAYPEAAKSGKLRVGRPFGLKVEVKNYGMAGVSGSGELELNLGSTGCRLADSTETLIKTFVVDSAVTWNLVAPDVPTSSSPIIVKYLKKPSDENTNLPAFDDDSTFTRLDVTTVAGGSISIALKLLGPAGAMDGVISTEQIIRVEANVTANGVDSMRASLLPGAFSFDADIKPTQSLRSGESVQWRLNAPVGAMSRAEIKVFGWGYDQQDETVRIESDTVGLSFDVIRRAEAEVIAAIVSPIGATDGKVSVGQKFTVRAHLENYGEASFTNEPYYLELALPAGYSTQDQLRQGTTAHQAVEWLIEAPQQPSTAATIEVRVPATLGPKDENSNQEVHFWQEKRRSFFAIETIQKTVILSTIDINRTPNTVVKGQKQVAMMGIRIFNQQEDEFSNNVILNGFNFTIKDRLGNPIENPAQVISRIAVTDYSDHDRIYGEVTSFTSGATIPLVLTQPDTVYPGRADSIDVIIDIAAEPTVNSVCFSVDGDSNIYVQEALTFNRPRLKNLLEQTGANLKLASDFCLVKADNLKEYFTNYPNPFGNPNRPTTTITYYLTEDTEVDIKIYTLIGELVWSRSYRASDPQGRKGPHDGDVIWDATNDKGYRVLNGVYIIYIKTGTGETAMTKAAVIK